jgi:hypothetical protein
VADDATGVRYERTVVGTLFVDKSGQHYFLDERGPQFFPSAEVAYESLEREGWKLRAANA